MMVLLPLLIGAVAGGLLGFCAGWLARGREQVVVEKVVTQTVEKIVPRTDDSAQRRDQASEILAQLQHLTSGVSARIDAHTRTVGDINEELSSATPAEAGIVVAAIQRLVDSNTTMQSQLQVAQTQLEEQASLLEAQHVEARTDPLTSLRNRRAFDDELSRRLSLPAGDQRSLSLMMLDVDHFKKCNDTYGHLAGDEVLRMVGKVLGDGASQLPDVFAARYGGEEFALLFSEQSLQSAVEIGDQIRRKIAQSPAAFDGQTIKVTASGGIADWKPGETTASFISRADEALYAAKKSGRNCSCIHELGTIRKHLVLPPPEKAVVRPPAAARTVEIESGEALSKAISRRIAEWRRGGPTLSLIVGRIDNLAALDAQGIQARNLAMQQAADYLKQSLREMDQVALLSGEIFGMLLPNGQLVDAVRIAERMRCGVHQGDLDKRLGAHVTISCGVAEVASDDDGDTLILRARRALEAARRRGGNAVYVNDGVYSTSAQDILEAAGTST